MRNICVGVRGERPGAATSFARSPKLSLQTLVVFGRSTRIGPVAHHVVRLEKQPGVTPLNRSTRPFVGY